MTFNYPTLKFQDILKSLCRNAEKGKLELLCMKVENTFHANYGHAWYPCGSMCPHAREKRTNKRELHSTTHFLDSKAKFGRLKTPSKGYVWKLALTCEPEMITLFQSKTAELLKQSLLTGLFHYKVGLSGRTCCFEQPHPHFHTTIKSLSYKYIL